MSRVKDEKYTTRTPGQPTGNKHKAHRAQISSKKCAAYLSSGRRVRNRDRRLARIARGFRTHETHNHLLSVYDARRDEMVDVSTRQPHKHVEAAPQGEYVRTCTVVLVRKNSEGKQVTLRYSAHHGQGKGPTAIPARLAKMNPRFCVNHHRWEVA